MKRVFIDTNILIYYFSKDPARYSLVENIFTDSQFKLITSTQVLSEFLSVILRKHVSDIKKVKSFLSQIIDVFEVVHFDENDLEKALDIKDKYQLSYYDSLIVANALKSNCTIIYTEDIHHGLKIRKKLMVINPFK